MPHLIAVKRLMTFGDAETQEGRRRGVKCHVRATPRKRLTSFQCRCAACVPESPRQGRPATCSFHYQQSLGFPIRKPFFPEIPVSETETIPHFWKKRRLPSAERSSPGESRNGPLRTAREGNSGPTDARGGELAHSALTGGPFSEPARHAGTGAVQEQVPVEVDVSQLGCVADGERDLIVCQAHARRNRHPVPDRRPPLGGELPP